MKKLVSLLLALIMVLGCVPMASAAAPKFLAANMSELSDIPEQPAIPEYTLETVDGKYVLTVDNPEQFTSSGNLFVDSHNENWDWDSVWFTYDEEKKAFISDRLLDLENYPEEPTLYFHLFNGETGMTNIQVDIPTGNLVWSYVEEYDGDNRYFFAWQPQAEEITVEINDTSAYYSLEDGSLNSYIVRTDDYDISYDPYGRINWVQGKIDLGDGYTMWVDWDTNLETWVTWDPETETSVPFETDLPAFDADEYPALITLPYEVKLAAPTIDVTANNVWERVDEDGNHIGYMKNGKNSTCYYDLEGNMVGYSYSNIDRNLSVEYDMNGTLLFCWYQTENTTYCYLDESDSFTLEDGTVVSGWYTWDEDGELILCDKPEGLEVPPALINAVKAVEEIWYPYNTMCVAGISLKDTYGITDKWYNVVPVDLTKDGTYTFDLVASGMFLIGKANVTVADGNVTVTYGMPWGHGYIKEEVLNWFTSPSQITAEFCEAPTGAYAFGEPVSISEDLGGAEVGLLFICNRVTYRQPYYNSGAHLVRWYSNKPEWKAFREQLMTIMPE